MLGNCLIRSLFVLTAAILTLNVDRAAAEAPEVVYQFPEDGATLETAPPAIQLCFRAPIDVRDLDKGGDFYFQIEAPGGLLLGHRAIFQPDGYGVVIQPGITQEPIGEWKFDWQVRDQETEEPSEGTISFTVAETGEAVIPADPPPCTAEGTPPLTSPTPENGSTEPDPPSEDGGGTDVLTLVLIAAAAAGVAGAVAMIAYVIRRRSA
jgi:hypothetical protein